MKKKNGIMLALVLILVLCSACQVRNITKGMEEGEHYDAVISIKKPEEGKETAVDSSAAADTDAAQTDPVSDDTVEMLSEYGVSEEDISVLQTMYAIPGMTDADTAQLLGGGAKNYTADQSYLIGRNYTVSLFGEECAFYTSYGSEDRVELAYVILPDREITWFGEILTLLYGEADCYTDENNVPIEWSWQKDGKMIWLYQDESIILDYSLDTLGEYG